MNALYRIPSTRRDFALSRQRCVYAGGTRLITCACARHFCCRATTMRLLSIVTVTHIRRHYRMPAYRDRARISLPLPTLLITNTVDTSAPHDTDFPVSLQPPSLILRHTTATLLAYAMGQGWRYRRRQHFPRRALRRRVMPAQRALPLRLGRRNLAFRNDANARCRSRVACVRLL